MKSYRKNSTIFFIIWLISIPLCFAANHSNHADQLKKIQRQITSTKAVIKSYQVKKKHLQSALGQTEKEIGKLSKTILSKQKEIIAQQSKLKRTNKEYDGLNLKIENQKKLLAKQLRHAYMLGKQPYLKVLFNQENPEHIARYLKYFHYFSQARVNIIQHIQKTADQIQKTAETLKKEKTSLLQSKKQLKSKKATLSKKQNHRKQIIAATARQIKSKQRRLSQLIADKARFEKVIEKINREKAYGYTKGKSLSAMRGKLHWPTDRHLITQHFHAKIAGGRLYTTGIVIREKLGAPIRAIFRGKVVFTDWLNGFGLLVIVRHGDYLTLYARNQSLYVKTGDIVEPGQLIATVGQSGGFEKPGLYFEIRKKNVPINPERWLKRG